MTRLGMRVGPVVMTLVAGSMSLFGGRAEAQYGLGYGLGYGFGLNQRPASIDFINQKSLLNASQATMGPVMHDAYAGNPNAYVNHLHDPGYLDKWDVGTRRTIEANIGRYSDGPPPRPPEEPSPGAVPAPPPRPIIALSSFYDRYQKLVWPDESPTFGQLGGKRALSDQSTQAVLNDYNLHGLAQLSTVTEARTRLIDYGQPALQYMRDNSTPRVADGFHLFLLSLYESLGQAATIPKAPATPRAQP